MADAPPPLRLMLRYTGFPDLDRITADVAEQLGVDREEALRVLGAGEVGMGVEQFTHEGVPLKTELIEAQHRIPGAAWATWEQRALAAEAEADRLRMLMDDDLSFQDLEMRMRNGQFDLRAVLGQGQRPATRFLAAIMLHAIRGDEDGAEGDDPANYRATRMEFDLTPGGTFQKLAAAIEVIKPGGKSSHELREELERDLARLRAEDPAEALERLGVTQVLVRMVGPDGEADQVLQLDQVRFA